MSVNWECFDYEKETKVDLGCLELENQDQSELIMKYGKERTRINKEIARQKESLGVLRAQLVKDIVKEASDAGEKKPTVNEIDAEILLDEDYQKEKASLIDLEHDHELLGVAIKALDAKSYALQEERHLLQQAYWSGTSRTNGVRPENRADADDRTRTAVNERRKRRAKK